MQMTLDRSNYTLFGLDLLQLAEHWRQGWLEALRWPCLARLLPPEPVRLLRPDGSEASWPARAKPAATHSLAVVLPDDLVLRQQLHLPLLPAAEQRQALELAVQAASPFPADATVWGYHSEPDGKGVRIDLALAASAHVADYLDQVFGDAAPRDSTAATGAATATAADTLTAPPASPSPPPPSARRRGDRDVEVWADGTPFVVLQGFGETRREARLRRARLQIAALLGLSLVLLLALAASPALHKQQQVADAQARLDALGREVAPIVATRDALGKTNLQLQAIATYIEARPDPVLVLGRLTQLLPDSVHLTRLEIKGHTVTIGGLADNAAGLMDTLGTQADFRDVKAPSAITRDRATGRESFSIEFKLAESVEDR